MAEALIKGASRRRIQWIRDHYRLETVKREGRPDIYRAINLDCDGTVMASIEGPDKAEVCRQARANWGHHNFRDEAVAFSEIFPPNWARGQR